jgi:hypothetical protein
MTDHDSPAVIDQENPSNTVGPFGYVKVTPWSFATTSTKSLVTIRPAPGGAASPLVCSDRDQ